MFKLAVRQTTRQLRPSGAVTAVARRYAHTPVSFDWKDPLGSSNLFTEEELAISETAESYCQERMLPRVLGMVNHALPSGSILADTIQMLSVMRTTTGRF